MQVLPHASLDEPRDDDVLEGGGWRSMMQSLFSPMVAAAADLTEAAQTLNREIWKLWGIRFEPVRGQSGGVCFAPVRAQAGVSR